MNEMSFVDIDLMFKAIMVGDASVITIGNIQLLNDMALYLYNIPQLDPGQVDTLKKIIMISNALYNRSDMFVLPI